MASHGNTIRFQQMFGVFADSAVSSRGVITMSQLQPCDIKYILKLVISNLALYDAVRAK